MASIHRALVPLACLTAAALACSQLGLRVPPTAVPSSTSTATGTPAATATPTETPSPTPTVLPPTPTPSHPPVARVLIISLDGVRPEALTSDQTPSIWNLAQRGAYTWSAQTVMPSVTLPAHASMLSGYDVAAHGLDRNEVPADAYIQSLTLFTLAHVAGLRSTMVVSSGFLSHIAVPGTVDTFVMVDGNNARVADEAIAQIQQGFGVLFVHMLETDTAGHSEGWLSPGYLAAVARADAAVGRVLAALDQQGLGSSTLVILTSDHGGHDRTHGTSASEDMTIPWMVAGPWVIPASELLDPVHTYDTTATALWALGLPIPQGMTGHPIREAFFPGGG
jgi:hypothetical protein